MKHAAFLSDGRIGILENGQVRMLGCITAEKYKEREREIRQRKDWKQSGTGAMFTGAYNFHNSAENVRLDISGLSMGMDDRLAFALNYENGGGIHFKSLDEEGLETPIFVDLKTHFYDLAVHPNGNIAVSCSRSYTERHIGFLKVDAPHLQFLTDGDCVDANPSWSLKDENVLYYDSFGVAYGSSGQIVAFGPRSINRLNIKTGELDEVFSDDKFDFLNPFEDASGNLYFIRRPYKPAKGKMSARDYAKAPGKIMRAFGGWLDWKTRTYTGESLNTTGANPAKGNQKTPQQIFVEGNLLEAEKTLKKNAAAGDKSPGIIPRSWELVVRATDGTQKVLQTSVMDYCVNPQGEIYSNGKYLIHGENAVKANIAAKLICL